MKRQKAQNNNLIENIIHGVFLIMGLITVGCVLLITVYLVISGIPAIREIGLREFLLGKVWASTAAEPKYGILPFILTSVYGTAGAMLLGVPIGFFTAVYLAKFAPRAVKNSAKRPTRISGFVYSPRSSACHQRTLMAEYCAIISSVHSPRPKREKHVLIAARSAARKSKSVPSTSQRKDLI